MTQDFPQSICVFCSSSSAVHPSHFNAARKLGAGIANQGSTLVYGGANVGLMGTLASSAKQAGGTVIGVLPRIFADQGLAFHDADELIFTGDLRERKAIMEQRADAFIALPGGLGTLEEILEVLTLKQIGRLHKPIAFVNLDGYYNPLFAIFGEMYREHFAKPWLEHLYHNCPTASSALAAIARPEPEFIERKWFD